MSAAHAHLSYGDLTDPALRATGEHWRKVAYLAPPIDLAGPAGSITILRQCIRSLFGIKAIITRDQGYHSGGFLPLPTAECALHLYLAFRSPLTGTPVPPHPRVTRLLVEGFFGDWLEAVLCRQQAKDVPLHGWHYLVFTNPDWRAPRSLFVPPADFLPWRQQSADLDRLGGTTWTA